jgi:hypothetical protein
MNNYLVKAIFSLKPNCEFKLENDDYSTIEWIVIEGKTPTQAEVDAEIKRLIAVDKAAVATKAEAKAQLLDRLGITAEEAALLLS